MKLSKLKYGKNNPRKISAEALEQLKKSITTVKINGKQYHPY